MIYRDEMRTKYNIDLKITSSYGLFYSYAKDAQDPIIFAHCSHKHNGLTPISYTKNNQFCTILIFLSGEYNFLFDGTLYTPTYGDVLVIRDHLEYVARFYPDSHLDYYEFNFPVTFFDALTTPTPFHSLFYDPRNRKSNLIHLNHIACDNIIHKLQKIEAQLSTDAPHTDYYAYSYIIQIVLLLCSCFHTNNLPQPSYRIPAKLKLAVDYINQNYLTLLRIEEIAAHCDISITYLDRLFMNWLRCTPNEYMNTLRISHAQNLLHQGASVTDACFQSGFQNYNYFITKFKSVTGITPLKFKTHRTDS